MSDTTGAIAAEVNASERALPGYSPSSASVDIPANAGDANAPSNAGKTAQSSDHWNSY